MKYQFINLNPLNELEEDCVCRAISYASGENYETIKDKLYLIARIFDCETLCVCCYKHLLDDVFKYTRINLKETISIKDFLKYNDKGMFIIRVNGHLTCALNGQIKDTWDCSNELVDIFWIVK